MCVHIRYICRTLKYSLFHNKMVSILFQLFLVLGLPSMITTDQGREFRNEVNAALMTTFGIKHRLTTVTIHKQMDLMRGTTKRLSTLSPSSHKVLEANGMRSCQKLCMRTIQLCRNHLGTLHFKPCLADRPSYL